MLPNVKFAFTSPPPFLLDSGIVMSRFDSFSGLRDG